MLFRRVGRFNLISIDTLYSGQFTPGKKKQTIHFLYFPAYFLEASLA
jgi:hypothetical protein